jgi:Flp pilus assembly protein TadD
VNSLIKLERPNAALEELERLARENPKESAVYVLMGSVYKKLGFKSEA